MDNNELLKDVSSIEDLVLTDDQINFNNTFNLKALNDTLEKLSVINFWNLYQTQRSRLGIEQFDIPFNEFLSTNRLMGEPKRTYYPRRYVAYVNYAFIDPELRKKYRNSEFYNVAINQETISDNPSIFRHNFLIFINGEFIFTAEVYPLESKTAIVIDVAMKDGEHGISYNQFKDYRDTNALVTVVMVPNYSMSNVGTNAYVLDNYDYKVPFSNIKNSEYFTNNTFCFVNMVDDIARRFYENRISCDTENKMVNIGRDISPGGTRYRFCFVTFGHLYEVIDIKYKDPFFRLNTKMPCPKEQMIIFKKDSMGRYMFTKDISIKMYYPNIYELVGMTDGDEVRVIVFQDEDELTKSEKYMNELAKYEEYVDMLPKYKNDVNVSYDEGNETVTLGSKRGIVSNELVSVQSSCFQLDGEGIVLSNKISELLKHYQPSSFVYSIDDFNGSIYVPSTMNYKVQKLHKTIYENPWALVTYLELLDLPTDKFYLDMETIGLDNRVRYDTTMEDTDMGVEELFFDEAYYVFAMNRHFVDARSYGFRIFIDGYFQCEENYRILPGPDFYFIYIPSNKITPTTVIEIERYKLFSFENTCSTNDISTPVIELDMSTDKRIGYSREIYVADAVTNKYLDKEKDFRIEALYSFAENGQRWATIPQGRNILIENKVRIYLTNEAYVGRALKVGINRTMAMTTGGIYKDIEDSLNGSDVTVYRYSEVKMANQGGYDLGGYRMFNNGKLLLPIQYFTSISRYQGSNDITRTSCELHEDDQFTVDRVPARFRVVYYQNEIDEENKRGYVDLDGKVPLPISLKWYDIYLNGVKLHKKNIEIISPTKFYIQGVDSRKHLMIIVRNRDPEIFKLPSHNPETDTVDYNNTIIDELMEEIGGLKEIIDGTKKEIDPNNETREIATDVCRNLDGLIFFYHYLVFTFINANKKQLTQEIKDAFPTLINEYGVIELDPNAGCIRSPEIGGYLIKLIECNLLNERSGDMFTDEGVSYDGLGTLQDRFAIRPLSTTNHEFGLNQEFMCDPETGEPAIKNDDGTVTTVSTIFRTKNFIESFSTNIMMYGMGKSDIYQITFDEERKVYVYKDGENVLSEDIETPKKIRKFAVGLDMTFLRKSENSDMLRVADINPKVTIEYLDGNTPKVEQHDYTRLANYVFDVDNNIITLKSITCDGIPDDIKTFIHSLLIAF